MTACPTRLDRVGQAGRVHEIAPVAHE